MGPRPGPHGRRRPATAPPSSNRSTTRWAQRFHPGGEQDVATVIREALEDVGLPAELAQLAGTDENDEPLRASHQRAIDLVGTDVGTPVIAVNGVAFFGPVVTPAPQGEAAAKLWDGCVLVAGTPGFFELKRTRSRGPVFG